MKQILCCLILIALATSAFSATSKTIPDLYSLNKGSFTSDYSITYNNTFKTYDDFGKNSQVSEAGDINNDGIPDFIVSNSLFDNSQGMVYVIYGKKGSLRQFDSMADFQPSDGFMIKGNGPAAKFGFSVSAAGDVNGDGIDDIIIGRPFQLEVGWVHVIFGRNSSSDFPSMIQFSDGNFTRAQGITIGGEVSTKSSAGFSVSGAGDVNGDGIGDIIIGAPGAGVGGKAYVVFGSKKDLRDMRLPPPAGKGFTVEGTYQENLGSSVSKVGDFNGDGVDDIIIGAHSADRWAGRAYIIYGRREGFPAVIPANDGVIIKGAQTQGYENLGYSVSGAGDFNGDGLQDVIVGAYQANNWKGAAWLILGSRGNKTEINTERDLSTSSRAFAMTSKFVSQLGMHVSGGRDLNGDGLSDIIVSAPALNENKGAVYVLYGYRQTSSYSRTPVNLDDLKPNQGYVIHGLKEGDRFGHFARPLKDVNQDGVNDLIIGAPGANGGHGAAYLFYIPVICSANCAQCSKSESCDVCAPNYGFLNGKCEICNPSTHILSNGNCIVKCLDNCAGCKKSNTCDVCSQGYGFLKESCVLCPADTHFLNNGNCIVKCSANCKYCSTPNTCESCASGYGFLNGHCVICEATTHFLNNGICVERLPENCAKSSGPEFCEVCIEGFGLLNNKCITCDPNTHTLSKGSCIVKCLENCSSCSQPRTCDSCSQNFGFLNGRCEICPSFTHILKNGFCLEKIPPNCAAWSGPEECNVCLESFGLLNGNCINCPAESHVLSNGVCKVKCSENCASCKTPHKCDVCSQGFGFYKENCIVCPADTHFLNNGFCIEDPNAWKHIKDFFGGLFN